MKIAALKHQFVTSVPEKAEDGVLYVSVQYRTAIHNCCCGCGHEVVTPLSPTDWQMLFDGVSVTLHPSIGNWSLACRSHYWVERNKIVWAGQWSDEEIAAGRANDRWLKARYYGQAASKAPVAAAPVTVPKPQSLWSRLTKWWP